MKCKFRSDEGIQCSAQAMKDSDYCFFHNPENQKQLKEAQARGGRANVTIVKNPLPPIEIKNIKDVVKLLEETVNDIRAGKLEVKVGNCIGILSGHLIKALEVASIANRVEIIERAILEKKTTYI